MNWWPSTWWPSTGWKGLRGSPTVTEADEDAATLPRDLMRKVRQIELVTDHLVEQGLAGDYHSVFRGRGMDFAEVRPYQPGDDHRTLDWNVTARMGAPYVKQYIEERDLTLFLALDVSGSLGYGSRAVLKRELAAELTALLAFAALRNGDRVGAALLDDSLRQLLKPKRRRNHVLRMVRDVLAYRPHPAAPRNSGAGSASRDSFSDGFSKGLSDALRQLRRRAVLFVISDFLPAPAAPEVAIPRLAVPELPHRALRAAAARHDLVVVELLDPLDDDLPSVAPVLLRDAEDGRTAIVHGRALTREHAELRQQRRSELRRLTRRLGADHIELRTDRPYLPALLAFFEARRKRMRRRR